MNRLGEITVIVLLVVGMLAFVSSFATLPFIGLSPIPCYLVGVACYMTLVAVLIKVDFLG